MHRGLFAAVILFTAHQQAGAQCKVTVGSNEGKLLAFYTAPIVFSMAIAPEVLQPASIRIGAEAEYIPKPDTAIEQTGACVTTKIQTTSIAAVFRRQGVTAGVP